MVKLSWREIRQNAVKFSQAWKEVTAERAEAQTFWNEFFAVFGLNRKLVATFEEPVKSLKNTHHRIDVFWKGTLLGEHKSAGESLDKAHAQAFQYVQELAASKRGHEIPRYIVVANFARMVLFDLQPDRDPAEKHAEPYERHEFALADLPAHVKLFGFLIGQQSVRYRVEDDANLEAAGLMAALHDAIEAGGYSGHALERLLVRLLFCLFADDTNIFDTNQFETYLRNRTRDDGSDLGAHLHQLFEVLDTPLERRQTTLDEELAAFPYINGELFTERLSLVAMTRDMRDRLLAAATFNWGRISPAVFGSLFQGIMDAKERRQIGAHYTSERDILKLIGPLFLDGLREEFAQIAALKQRKVRDERLAAFQEKLAGLRFLDPACGCGNFLVIAYRELRRLELQVLELLHGGGDRVLDLPLGEIYKLSKVDVHQFYGIEIDEWPARIAETALWLTDHQMNTELSLRFGNTFQRIPLKATPHIVCANALRMDWNELLPAKECSYVLGNPPFVGHHYQSRSQKEDQSLVMAALEAGGVLDYVCNWYFKAAGYIKKFAIDCAFVSTNSITQGEQVGILWSLLHGSYRLEINFAYRTFAWQSEARGKANVHVVIIGFSTRARTNKLLYEGLDDGTESKRPVKSISPYLIEGSNVFATLRSQPLCDVPPMRWGNKASDGGNLIFTEAEMIDFLKTTPDAAPLFRKYYSAEDFLYGTPRYCLWLKEVSPETIRRFPRVKERVEKVREFRAASKAEATRKYAAFPALFRQIAQPDTSYLLIPRVSSERRKYIPIAYVSEQDIAGDVQLIAGATNFHFGVLTSEMHMAWVRTTCGRVKSDFRYLKDIVYNNFPWPMEATEEQRGKVSACAQEVLTVREKYLGQGATLADLYDPASMPGDLVKAHQGVDRAVDRCYRNAAFGSERERVEYLFGLYEALTAPLAAAGGGAKKKARGKGK